VSSDAAGSANRPPTPPPAHAGDDSAKPRVSWTNRVILGVVVLVTLAAGGLITVAFLPRWWAQRVGQVSDGSFTAGVFSGLTCGVVFTALPLLALRMVVRRRARWGTRLVWLVVAALVASPNLTTLGIVLGSGNAAHAGQRIMDVDAPGFRGATLVGAILGAIGILALWTLLAGRRRRRREVTRLRAELKLREADRAEESGARPSPLD
jgi:MFS family permease